MLVGIDFDNTIVCYGELFYQAAVNRALVPPDLARTKEAVRDHLRNIDQEDPWTELQGFVYGRAIEQAEPFPGVIEFLARCRVERVEVAIISHRTRRPYRGEQFDLHEAARQWLRKNLLGEGHQVGLLEGKIFFEETKSAKLDRIAAVGCTHFVDDLPEFLAEPEFPNGVTRILFDPHGRHEASGDLHRASSWREIAAQLLGADSP